MKRLVSWLLLVVLLCVSGSASGVWFYPLGGGAPPSAPVTLNSVTVSGNTFVGGASSATIGAVTVNTTPTSSFTGTLSLSGANTGLFALSSPTVPSNLVCGSGGCPAAGTYSDVAVIATMTGATGSPLSSGTLSLTGSSGVPTCNTPPIHVPNIAGDCLVSTDTTDQIAGPRANAPTFADNLTFNSSGLVQINGVELAAGQICRGFYAPNGSCSQTSTIYVCATPGNVTSNTHPWLIDGMAAWQAGTPAFESDGTTWHPGAYPSFLPVLTFNNTANYQNTALSFMTSVCPSGGGSTSSSFVDNAGQWPNFSTATNGMTSNDTLTIGAPPSGYPFWPGTNGLIGPDAGSSSPIVNPTVTLQTGTSFGYVGQGGKGLFNVTNNGTTINGTGTRAACFWVSPGNNQACIPWVAGLDLTVNNFRGEFAGMGIDRATIRQGIFTMTNVEMENMGCMGGGCSAGFNHNIYIGLTNSSGFDTTIANNLAVPDVLENGWNAKMRTPNSQISNSFLGQWVNNGAASTHGPIDYPCGGTHSVTNSTIETNEYSFNSALSTQQSAFLSSAYEENATNVATTTTANVLAGGVCANAVSLPTYSASITGTITSVNTFTTTTNPALLFPWFTFGNSGYLWDMGVSGLMVNGPAWINSWTGPVGGLYTVRIGQDSGSCYNGEGTLPLKQHVNIYSCFAATSGTVTLYAIGGSVNILSNTSTTASISVPMNPAAFGIAVGDTVTDHDALLSLTSITGTGPYTLNFSCPHPSFAGGGNCITPLDNVSLQNVAVTSGTYNNSTGATSLTIGADVGLTTGSSVTITNLYGTLGGTPQTLSSLNGTYTATAGTSGTTLNFTAASGLGTIVIGSVGGAGVGVSGSFSFSTVPSCAPNASTTGVGCPDFLNKQGPVQITASTTGSGCDGTNTLCQIALNPIGMQVWHGVQVFGTGIAAKACMVAGQMDFIYPQGGSTGSGYSVGQTITLAGGTFEQAAVYTIDTVSSGAITGGHISTGGVYTAFTKTFTQASTSGSGTGAQFQFPHPMPIVTGTGPYTLRLAQPSGANCISSAVSNQVYQTLMPLNITWNNDLIVWDGQCIGAGTCSLLNVATVNPAWQTTSLSNSIIVSNVATGGPSFGTAGPGGLLTYGMTDGGGNINCNNRTDLTTSTRCAIPAFTAATFTAGISNGTLTVGCGTGCMSITSGTYNSTNGQVTLTVSQSNAIPWNWGPSGGGQGAFTISGITGTGTVSSLNGNWFVTSGTTGTTLTFNGPPGLGSLTITGGNINPASGASACQPGMFVWDQQPVWGVGEPGRMIAGTSIVSGTAPTFALYIPPGGVITRDIPAGTQMTCGWGTPASAFNGQIASNGNLTVNSGLVGSVHIGDYLTDISGNIGPNVQVITGSGTAWTTNYAGSGVAAEYMVSVRTDAPLPASAPTITSISLSPAGFTYSGPAGEVIGTLTANMSSGTFTGTFALTGGANTGGFAVSGNTLTCGSSGCPSSGGPFNDLQITATPTTGTAFTQSTGWNVTGSAITISSIIAPTLYPPSGSANQNVGAVTVATTGGTANVHLTITGTNASGFHLAGAFAPTALLCRSTSGCPASGTVADFSIKADQAPATLTTGQSLNPGTAVTIVAVRQQATLYQPSATVNTTTGRCNAAEGCIGDIIVYMSDSSAFNGTVALSGTGSSNFQIVYHVTDRYNNTTSNVLYCNTTCPADNGPYNITITATPSGGSGTPVSVSLTGVTGTLSDVVSQIHNAPGWIANNPYAPSGTVPKTRVLSGVGYTPGTTGSNGTYHPGQALAAYELDPSSPNPCTSAASGQGPAGGTSTPVTGTLIVDGTCKWNYLSTVDYITETGWSFDNAPWVSGKMYFFGDIITSDTPLRAYGLNNAYCTSTVAPTGSTGTTSATGANGLGWWGSGFNYFTTSDNCQWVPFYAITYSSQKSHIPSQINANPDIAAPSNWIQHIMLQRRYIGQFWNDALYQAGFGGEAKPLLTDYHAAGHGEVAKFGTTSPCFTTVDPVINACFLVLEPAPPGSTTTGEGFANGYTPSTPMTGFDPTKGVAFYNPGTNPYPLSDVAFMNNDNNVLVNGLQLRSVHFPAFSGLPGNGSGGGTGAIVNSIMDAPGDPTGNATGCAIVTDGFTWIANNLIIARGNCGIGEKYATPVTAWNTIICPSGTCEVGVSVGHTWIQPDPIVVNSAIFGFAHAGAGMDQGEEAYGTKFTTTAFTGTSSMGSGNNVTDAPSGDSGTVSWMGAACPGYPGGSPPNCVALVIPGTTYGSTTSAAFVNWSGGDFRPKVGGPLIGAGVAFGNFSSGICRRDGSIDTAGTTCPAPFMNYDGHDFLGVARPHNSHYTVGAESEP